MACFSMQGGEERAASPHITSVLEPTQGLLYFDTELHLDGSHSKL